MTEARTRLIVYVDGEHTDRVAFRDRFGHAFDVQSVERAEDVLEVVQADTHVAVVVANNDAMFAELRRTHPRIVRVGVADSRDLGPTLRAVREGLVSRYVEKPWDDERTHHVLVWALEAHEIGRRDAVMQARLLETERLAILGTLSSAVFHDLRQPLSYMKANLERLEQLTHAHALEGPMAELPELVSDILQGCNLLVSLTKSVQELQRRAGDLELSTANVSEAVGYCVRVCRQMSARLGVELTVDLDDDVDLVQIEHAQLTQVLVNLVMNAIESYEDCQRDEKTVAIRARRDASNLWLEVEDRGVGITEANLERIGTPFFTTRPTGTGLGVMQCRRLVESAGGTFTLESVVGAGTTARVSLRIEQPMVRNGADDRRP